MLPQQCIRPSRLGMVLSLVVVLMLSRRVLQQCAHPSRSLAVLQQCAHPSALIISRLSRLVLLEVCGGVLQFCAHPRVALATVMQCPPPAVMLALGQLCAHHRPLVHGRLLGLLQSWEREALASDLHPPH